MPHCHRAPARVSTAGATRTLVAFLAVAAVGGALALLGAAPASAVTSSGWAAWTPITGRANDYATTMTLLAGGFPRAIMASDSRANVSLPSGASTFLGPLTPVGAKYGASRNQAYVNLRPRADTSTTPSTTTYTFDSPTPPAGWTFVLGDVDADEVSVRATDGTGQPVSAATVDGWYRSSFNYDGDIDAPTWDGATSTLHGNPSAADTNGAAAWFEPDVALTSLTFVFTARSGFPIYQTWFASIAHTIGGRVGDVSAGATNCPVDSSVVRLLAPDGTTLATTSPTNGAYSFGQYATQPGYRVTLEAPQGCALESPEQRTVDTTAGDATADFTLRAVVPQPVRGTVRTPTGTPVPGATITLTPPTGPTRTTTTDADGHYLFDENAEQPGYRVAVTGVPDGFDVSGADAHAFDITPGQDVPDQDFTLVEQPSVQGTVSGGGSALGGVPVTLTPTGGGAPTSTATAGDGRYEFPHVPAGTYAISVDAPPGYRPAPDREGVAVGTEDLSGQDFHLTRPGTLSGRVTEPDGTPLPKTDVLVTHDGETGTLTTDQDGLYYKGDLDPGAYDVTVAPVDGYRTVGTAARSVTITAAGEIRGGIDFVLAAITGPVSTSPAPTSPVSSPTAAPAPSSAGTSPVAGSGSGGGTLADTGTDVAVLLLAGLAVVLVGAAVSTAARRR